MSEPADRTIPWWADDPHRLVIEKRRMSEEAPDLAWSDKGSGEWHGQVPLWPFHRPRPAGVIRLCASKRLAVQIFCNPAHPMIEPLVYPQLALPVSALGLTAWHLLPDGRLCLLPGRSWWDPNDLIAELIPRISGWYLEFLLAIEGRITEMTEQGISTDRRLDPVLEYFPGWP